MSFEQVGIKFGERIDPRTGGLLVYVKRLVQGGPAATSGRVNPGDILVLINGMFTSIPPVQYSPVWLKECLISQVRTCTDMALRVCARGFPVPLAHLCVLVSGNLAIREFVSHILLFDMETHCFLEICL